jgi:hypothetical protein
MLAALVVAGVLALAAIAALVVLALRSQLAPGPSLAGRTVVVHTKRPDDKTIRGVLHAQHADRWTLREAVLVTPIGDRPLGGLQHVLVTNMSFTQELEAPLEPKARES